MDYLDLHTHSTASDGTLTPSELFLLADELKLTAVALTDHDTVAGIPEFLEAAKSSCGCEAVAGVELATIFYNREIHIVGLFIDHTSQKLNEYLQLQRQERIRRNQSMVIKLNARGYQIELTPEVMGPGDLSSWGRPHFAHALVEKYGFSSSADVFDKLLGKNRPAYVPRKLPSPEAAINAIHEAGGVAVWAHPVLRDCNERAFLLRTTRKLSALGLDAMEGYYSMFGPAETALVAEVTQRFNLAMSGGSDFHGANSANIVLGFGTGGLRVPDTLLPLLKSKRDS